MDISIKEAIKGGKYVNIHRAKPKLTIDVDLLGHCKEIIFDADVCTAVPTWTKEKCIGEGSGIIKLYMIPNGYMPELNIEGVTLKYMGPSPKISMSFWEGRTSLMPWTWYRAATIF